MIYKIFFDKQSNPPNIGKSNSSLLECYFSSKCRQHWHLLDLHLNAASMGSRVLPAAYNFSRISLWLVWEICLSNAVLCGSLTQGLIRTLGPTQNGHHFSDNIFNSIFLDGNLHVLTQIPREFVLKSPIRNKAVLVQIMAWRQAAV